MSDPVFEAMLEKISKAQAEGKPVDALIQTATDYLQSQPASYADGKRNELLLQMNLLRIVQAFGAVGDGDDEQETGGLPGMANMAELLASVEAEAAQHQAKRRQQFMDVMAKASIEAEKRQTEHRNKRKAMGLAEEAGTGQPEARILIHGLKPDEVPEAGKDRNPGAVDGLQRARNDAEEEMLRRIPLGLSRLGGLPDLPPGQEWPTHAGKKLPFLCQLNLTEFPPAAHRLLPADGHLFAFALTSGEEEHWPPPVKVFLYHGPAETLVRAAYPWWDEIWGGTPDLALPATGTPNGSSATERSGIRGETLGWLFGEVSGEFGTAGEIADDRMQDGDDWINLLALESAGSMTWSDAGHLYLLIRRSALEKLDFSNVLAAVCSS